MNPGPALYLYNLVSVLGVGRSHLFLGGLKYLFAKSGHGRQLQGSGPWVYENNAACIRWTNNVIGGRERAKHIDIRTHFVLEALQLGHLRLKRVSSIVYV